MSTKKNTFARKALASVGAAALGLMGVIGLSATAMAADVAPGQPGAPADGTLTIHKYASDENTGDPEVTGGEEQTPGPDKTPVQGAVFTAYKYPDIDLATNAGWTAVQALTAPGNCDAPPPGTSYVFAATSAAGIASQTLPVGAYLVCETTPPPGLATDGGSIPFIVTIPMPNGEKGWNYNVHAYPKNIFEESELSKEVENGTAVVQGDTVSWTVTSEKQNAPVESFILTDTVDANLSHVAPAKVTVTAHLANNTTVAASSWFESSISGQVLTSEATGLGLTELNKLPAGYYLTFTYETTVNGPGILENQATIGETTVSASTPWGVIKIEKQDSANASIKLEGATFEVYAGACPLVGTPTALDTLVTSNVGTATSKALIDPTNGTPGTDYCLKETVAPAGYQLPTNVYTTVNVKAGAASTADVVKITNVKVPGPQLPLTGANGTMLMTVGGIALVAVAGGLFMVTRRKADQK